MTYDSPAFARHYEREQLELGLEALKHQTLVIGDQIRMLGMAAMDAADSEELAAVVADLRGYVQQLAMLARRRAENEDLIGRLR